MNMPFQRQALYTSQACQSTCMLMEGFPGSLHIVGCLDVQGAIESL